LQAEDDPPLEMERAVPYKIAVMGGSQASDVLWQIEKASLIKANQEINQQKERVECHLVLEKYHHQIKKIEAKDTGLLLQMRFIMIKQH